MSLKWGPRPRNIVALESMCTKGLLYQLHDKVCYGKKVVSTKINIRLSYLTRQLSYYIRESI